jgi:hypothetical protein
MNASEEGVGSLFRVSVTSASMLQQYVTDPKKTPDPLHALTTAGALCDLLR